VIVGLGVELVDAARFEALLERFGERLRQRLFTAGERAYAARKARGAESLAVRFAAKAAARRALALPRLAWQEAEVVREGGRAPTLNFHGAAAVRARELGVRAVSLTLTHDPRWCVGQVVLEGETHVEGLTHGTGGA
jgi:holo-[acyl-carrier protein] synthase